MLFNKLKEPIFLKANQSAIKQLEALNLYLTTAPNEIKEIIQKDIKFIKYGLNGESNIEFELKNSHLPMYVIHDLVLSYQGNTSQIDYLIIAKSGIYCIECKNLIGDIEINSRDEFIRSYRINGKLIKEALYSPITQNERHYQLIKTIRLAEQTNVIQKFFVDQYFDTYNYSLVVIANPKSILNTKYARKEIKDKVIRADQLVNRIKEDMNNKKNESWMLDKTMEDFANYFITKNKMQNTDYVAKYQTLVLNLKSKESHTNNKIDITQSDLYKRLKNYRLNKSRFDNIKPYFIFNNKELENLVKIKPTCMSELLTIAGFGEVKCNKYGQDILSIINN